MLRSEGQVLMLRTNYGYLLMNIKYSRLIGYVGMLLMSVPCGVWGQTAHRDSTRAVRLQEVVVTAVQADTPESRSVIGRDAIRHIQAMDLSDLSQLLPGVLSRNPDLNRPAAFTIRSISGEDPVNAMGTGIWVDGLRMSNNANMQQCSLEPTGKVFNSAALSGYDVRCLSPSSIERVEVIRGVPSVRYGDVTSGVVMVQSRAGVQPFTAALRFTATEKLLSAGKGISLGDDGGTLYAGADYTLSTPDIRKPEQAFRRWGMHAAYAKDFTKATLRMNFRGYYMQDKEERGNNTVDGEFQKALHGGLAFSARGRWSLKKPWLTSIEYAVGVNTEFQKNRSGVYYSGTRQVAAYATQSGEHEGVLLSPNYFTNLSVEGKPLTADASLIAHWEHAIYNKVYHHFVLGIEAGTEGNRGEGISFDPLTPPLNMAGVRKRSYKDLPFVHRYAAFAESRLRVHAGKRMTEVRAGVRVNKLRAGAVDYSPTIEPRINLKQVLWQPEGEHARSSFSIRAGWGLMYKAPVLAYLYPGKAYTDVASFIYNDTENDYRMAVMHTFVTDNTVNPGLRLPVNSKLEAGIEWKIKGVAAEVVWFKEHLRNGYCSVRQAEPFTYRSYSPLVSKGERPWLADGGVVNNGVPLPYDMNTGYALYMRPQNGVEQHKEGVEYTIDWGRWNLLSSSFLVSGSYVKMREKCKMLSAFHPQVETGGKPYPYVGIYETDAGLANLRTEELCSSRFQCITHIPGIGLVTSLTLQAVWMDKQRRYMESDYGNPVYLADENGNRMDGDAMADGVGRKRLNPVYYMDGSGNLHRFTGEMARDKRFADLVLDAATPTAFLEDSFRPYFLLNVRLTKEIGRHVSVAFCANNITRTNPKRYLRSARQYSLVNSPLYYGAEVNIQF